MLLIFFCTFADEFDAFCVIAKSGSRRWAKKLLYGTKAAIQ